jgi:periplasmic protein TonB
MDCIENLHLVNAPRTFDGRVPVTARDLKQALLISLILHLAGGLLLAPYLYDAAWRHDDPHHELAIWVVPVSPAPEVLAPTVPPPPRRERVTPPHPVALPVRPTSPNRELPRPLMEVTRPVPATKAVSSPLGATVPVATLPAGPAQMVLPAAAGPAVLKGKAGTSLPSPVVVSREGASSLEDSGPYSPAGYRDNPTPEYPSLAKRLKQQGTAVLRVWVNALGSPEQVKLRETSGSRILDQAALEAVRQWRFAPARRGANPVSSWVEVPVSFRFK